MKRTFLALALILIVAPQFTETASAQSMNYTVMTWNIRYNNPNDGPDAWPHRKDWVAEIIQREKIDLVGLQEVPQDQYEDLQERLPDLKSYGVGRNDGKRSGEAVPIFYRPSRFELIDKSTFWLSKTPDKPGSKDWDAAITRIVSWVKLKDKRTEEVFYFMNTHFDHRGPKARQESAKLLIEKLRETFSDHPVILTGDFNTKPGSEPYQILTADSEQAAFRDAKSVSMKQPTGPDSTWCGFKAVAPGQRIDLIFATNGVQVQSHQTLVDQKEGRFPSDHLAVVAKMKVE